MNLMVAKALSDLPENVRTSLQAANPYYSDEYQQYIRQGNSEPIYIYNAAFVQVVSLHTIQKIFHTASLPSEPHAILPNVSREEQAEFLDQMMAVLKKQFKVDWINVTPAGSLFLAYPTCSERICFGNHVIDLTPEEDVLLAGMDSKHRNMVRRGERGEIVVRFGGIELLDDYILLDKQTWERSGQTIDHTEFYKNYITTLGNHVTVGIAYKDQVPQCGLIGLHNKKMFYYMFGASAHRPEPGSTHFLQWQTILKMKQAGVEAYNFVGCRLNEDKDSKYHNIQHFKKGFGGQLQECFMFRATLSKPKKWLFHLLMRMKTGKVPQDVIDQEIYKWKKINC